MTLTAEQRSLRAQIAANTRWSNVREEERKRQARRGQTGLRRRFADEITQQHGDLEPDELEAMVTNRLRAHMQRLALASSKARQS